MRKYLAILLCMFLAMPCAALAEHETSGLETPPEHALDNDSALPAEDDIISMAIDVLMPYWQDEVYATFDELDTDGYFEIKWARVIYINDAIADPKASEIFGSMRCYVEFMILSDYYGAHPYHGHAGLYECVALNKDGQLEVCAVNPIDRYQSLTYLTDFTQIIDSVSDRGSEFNQTHYLGQ